MTAIVAGIDVGGDKKGCNLVILRGSTVVCSITGAAPEALLEPCLEYEVVAVGIDAPCLWRIKQTGVRSGKLQLRNFKFFKKFKNVRLPDLTPVLN